MIHLTFRTHTLLMTIPLLTLIAHDNAHAEIYKWRDNRGVTQYSDRPPINDSTKVSDKLTVNEIVNSLQTKDLCADGPIKKNVATNIASAKDNSGFYNIFARPDEFNLSNKNITMSSKLIGGVKAANVVTKASGSKVANVTNTAGGIRTAGGTVVRNATLIKSTSPIFNTGMKNTPKLSFTKLPIKTVTTAPVSAPKPVVSAPPAALSAAPVVSAPPVATPPTQVAAAPAVTPPVVTAPTTNSPANLPNIVQAALMPAVDISKNIIPVKGHSSLRISQTSEVAPNSGGEFRISCGISHMSNDDPLVYPNQQGAAHHHTFFGNTSVNYKSDLNTFNSVGNSTCAGGTMNRSAYWVPSMINTETNAPITPSGNVLVYYKNGAIDGALIQPPPKGLRMLAGDSKAKDNSVYNHAGFTCHPGPNSKRTSWPRWMEIPSGEKCQPGDDLMFSIMFPQCWDGKNLDSPNHKDHMAYASHRVDKLPNFYCPATHPVAIPEVAVNVHYTITNADKLDKWRLASDNYPFNGKNAGYSAHSDYVEGWDRPLIEGIVKNCINGKKDCHAHLLGDGKMFY